MRLKVTYIFIFISKEIKRGRISSLQEINKERKGGSIKKERVYSGTNICSTDLNLKNK